MHARELLQVLKSALERDLDIVADEINLSITGTYDKAQAIVTLPVEGRTRIIQITAKELGMYEGLSAGAVA